MVRGGAIEGEVSCIILDSTWQLFRIARDTEALVADHLVLAGVMHRLDISFIWTVQEWQLESVVIFMDLIYSSMVNWSGMGTICWTLSFKEHFWSKILL